MNEKMSISEMMDALRTIRNFATGMTIGLFSTGKNKEAEVWERGLRRLHRL